MKNSGEISINNKEKESLKESRNSSYIDSKAEKSQQFQLPNLHVNDIGEETK